MTPQSTMQNSRTDWARLDAMTDEEIDTSDIPPLTEEQLQQAALWPSDEPLPVVLRLEPKVYPVTHATLKEGSEPFHQDGHPLGLTMLNFWQWLASDVLSNAMRGLLAEYIVATALGTTDRVRGTWDAHDLTTAQGIKVEVKSSGYVQSWYNGKLSIIKFDIRPTRYSNDATNILADESRRQADVYVFCLLQHQNKLSVDPLNLNQWTFYILSAATLNRYHPAQKTMRLSVLLKLKPAEVPYREIAACVERIAAGVTAQQP